MVRPKEYQYSVFGCLERIFGAVAICNKILYKMTQIATGTIHTKQEEGEENSWSGQKNISMSTRVLCFCEQLDLLREYLER